MNLFGYSRVLAVGDVHGMYDKLVKLYRKIKFNPEEDLLVFLGDYIDRGPDPVGCLRFIKGLKDKYGDSVVCLMGNHELMMASWAMKERGNNHSLLLDYSDAWPGNGGLITWKEIKSLSWDEQRELVDWVTDLPVWFRYKEFYFCHAGIDVKKPLAAQAEVDLLWKRDGWRVDYQGEDVIVVGHTPVQRLDWQPSKKVPKPLFQGNNVILCDTGAYMEHGRLSCVDVLTHKVWQT